MAATPTKIRYRKVSTRMWNDREFLALSAPKPNARDLWVWLIAGPLTTPVPGVVLATMGSISDRLGWPPAATRRCWQEIADRQMATADWSHSLVWLPNALKHNPPESPNVAKSWRRYFDENVPECDLRTEIETFTLAFLGTLERGKAFSKAFAEAFAQGFKEGEATPFPESGNRSTGTKNPPNPPAGAGGRLTRRELAQAEKDLAAFVATQPKPFMGPLRQMPADYQPPRPCPHEPLCADRESCLTLLALQRRAKTQSVATAFGVGVES